MNLNDQKLFVWLLVYWQVGVLPRMPKLLLLSGLPRIDLDWELPLPTDPDPLLELLWDGLKVPLGLVRFEDLHLVTEEL